MRILHESGVFEIEQQCDRMKTQCTDLKRMPLQLAIHFLFRVATKQVVHKDHAEPEEHEKYDHNSG